ncbi:MAG: hypothetical protein II527_04985 [Bacteroidales bacterium]|nr:hypothetical protein [Bacteroidales bacterium]MBQ2483123.1 hypothetical protein [Bacteroidales bacterium]MBQ2492669.1 hypothetical protein [Bacteroidales bacterium]MBQ4197636.1 hypothetical protein [Bacteroidales bacterium]
MTYQESALYSLMQERRFSYGCCLVALNLLKGHPQATNEMLLFITDHKRLSEKRLTEELGRICREYEIDVSTTT